MNKYSLLKFVPDKVYLRLMYYKHFRKLPSFRVPKTFNEKLQWLKLYDRKPVYTIMVDKVEAKRFVADKIGEEYIIPTLAIYDSAEDIDIDKLPAQFVLKCNHDSKSVCVCKDKKCFDIEKAKKFLGPRLKANGYWYGREWPYKDVVPKILAEKYMEESNKSDLKDYKLMCFNGKVRCTFVCSDRSKDLKVTFFDNNWNKMPFERHYPSSKKNIAKPVNFEKMIELAELLSKDIPFVRVDFYEVNGKIYFGELTFFPGAGFEEFTPEKWDFVLGEWIKLPDKKG